MESNVKDSVQTQESSASTEQESKKVEERQSPVDDYKRDMFKFKSRAKELEEKLQEYELREQEQKGNLQDVIAKLKDENRGLKQSVAQSQVSFAEGKIEDAVKTTAAKLGCTDPETFYRLLDRTDIDMIELDDKFRVNSEDVNGLVDKYRKNYEHLGFFNRKVNVVDGTPNSKPLNERPKQKPLTEMTQDELLAYAEANGMKRIKR